MRVQYPKGKKAVFKIFLNIFRVRDELLRTFGFPTRKILID